MLLNAYVSRSRPVPSVSEHPPLSTMRTIVDAPVARLVTFRHFPHIDVENGLVAQYAVQYVAFLFLRNAGLALNESAHANDPTLYPASLYSWYVTRTLVRDSPRGLGRGVANGVGVVAGCVTGCGVGVTTTAGVVKILWSRYFHTLLSNGKPSTPPSIPPVGKGCGQGCGQGVGIGVGCAVGEGCCKGCDFPKANASGGVGSAN